MKYKNNYYKTIKNSQNFNIEIKKNIQNLKMLITYLFRKLASRIKKNY